MRRDEELRISRFHECMLLLAAAASACGPRFAPHEATTSPGARVAAARISEAPAPLAPARWVLQPSAAAQVNARRTLSDGRVLLVGPRGARWLQGPAGVQSAATLVDSNLVGAVETARGQVVLVGSDGSLFGPPQGAPPGTDGVLGPVVLLQAHARLLHSVSAGRSTILGIDAGGNLTRIAGGGGWSLPSLETRPLAAVMRDDGVGLVVAPPHGFVLTADDGATWIQAGYDLAQDGVRRVYVDASHRLVVEGLTTSHALTSPQPTWQDVTSTLSAPLGPGLTLPDKLGGSNAVREGRAALTDGKWLEVVEASPQRWALFEAELGQIPSAKALDVLDGCSKVAMAADAAVRAFACAVYSEPPVVRLFESTDGGGSYKEGPTLRGFRYEHSSIPLLLFALPGGDLLVSGAWIADEAGSQRGRLPLPLVHVGREGARPATAEGLIFLERAAPDGTVYALGQGTHEDPSGRREQGALLMTSRDGGRSFASTVLGSVDACSCKPFVNGSIATIGSLAAGDRGSVVVIASGSGKLLRYTSSDYGAHLQGAVLPLDGRPVELAGPHGFAYRVAQSWESADYGATWTQVVSPTISGVWRVACEARGCLFGVEAARIGWGAAPSESLAAARPAPKLPAQPPAAEHDAPPTEQLPARTLRCSFDGRDWKLVGNPFVPADIVARLLPISIRKTHPSAWVAREAPRLPLLESFPRATYEGISEEVSANGSVAAVTYRQTTRGLVTTRSALLGPAREGEITAERRTQLGIAALRQSPADPTAPSELAWVRAGNETVHRRKLVHVGALDWAPPPGAPLMPSDLSHFATPTVLSVEQNGLYVRPGSADRAPLYFVRDTGEPQRIPWPEIPSRDAQGEPLSLVYDARHFERRTMVTGSGAAKGQLVIALSDDVRQVWEQQIVGMWPDKSPDGIVGSWRLLGESDALGLGVAAALTETEAWWGFRLALGPKLPNNSYAATPVSTMDLAAELPACRSPVHDDERLIVPLYGRNRQEILPPEELHAPAARASTVMLGLPDTKKAGCVVAASADFGVPGEGAFRAFVVPDVERRSLLFELPATDATEPVQLRARGMTCRYVPHVSE
jgi:hypothetical protein